MSSNSVFALGTIELVPREMDASYYPAESFSVVIEGQNAGTVTIANAADTAEYYAGLAEAEQVSLIAPNDAWLSHVSLVVGEDDKGFRHKGYGKLLYHSVGGLIMAQGLRFRTDPDCITQDAMNVWQSLIREGSAQEQVPFWQDSDGDFQGGVIVYDRGFLHE